ncbi:MAG: tRNA pseudouridine(13) synthase TruD [Candidatus Micrarchaeota archaeon]
MKLSYLSKTAGIGGSLKTACEDFLVEEIEEDGTVLELDKPYAQKDVAGQFTWFVLQKKEWTSEGALRRIADAFHVGHQRFSYAGTKDKMAISTQLVSAFSIPKENLLSLQLKDIKILGAWSAADKVKLGQLLGNRFTIRVAGAGKNANATVKKISKELGGAFPNYFGEQRFGSARRNTHIIGENLIRGRADLAVTEFLCSWEGEKRQEAVDARKNLKTSGDFGRALHEFPQSLRLERSMLAHLQQHQRDYHGALRKLPRSILLLFIHAFQSHIFNEMLSRRIAEGELEKEEGEYYCGESLGFPDLEKKSRKKKWLAGRLVGYETVPNEREKYLLEEFLVKPADFKIKSMPEVSSKGTNRLLLAPLKDFSFKKDTFSFSLPSGCYATVAMREFTDGDKK